MLDIAGIWRLPDASGQITAHMALPGDAITALHKAGHIPDPYFGRNEYECRWVAERDWVLRRSFTAQRTDMLLVIDMLDTVAEVCVNGVPVLKADTMFRAHQVNVSSALRVGENEIEIRFPSVISEAARRLRDAILHPLFNRQLPDPERQYAAQTRLRFRLRLEHSTHPVRGLRGAAA